jgi:dGTPase
MTPEGGGPAPWAQRDDRSRGRRHPEQEHAYRPPYARDRDRIIHCRAFRRLEYKTQVFVNHEGDHYRTRLTHSLEVAQIARTVARALGLNGDLGESLALCHDLGHTPFGHLGEDVLDPLLAEHGGFDHNRQTLRVVEVLEERYPQFPGLNLTWETREGIVKHSGPPNVRRAPEAAEYLPDVPPPLEAQMIDLVDELAYNHHDIDDGLESRLLDTGALADAVPLFGRPFVAARAAWPAQTERMWVKIALRGVIDRLVSDVVDHTRSALEARGVRSLEDVRALAGWVAGLSPDVAAENRVLKSFLNERLYQHPRIVETKRYCAGVLRDLFECFSRHPDEMPARFRERAGKEGPFRAACDYLAGMTDRYALLEHRRLCGGPNPGALPFATR